jgi:hypothetical protein
MVNILVQNTQAVGDSFRIWALQLVDFEDFLESGLVYKQTDPMNLFIRSVEFCETLFSV